MHLEFVSSCLNSPGSDVLQKPAVPDVSVGYIFILPSGEPSSGGRGSRGEQRLPQHFQQGRADCLRGVLGPAEQHREGLVTPEVAGNMSVFIPCTNTDTGERVIIRCGT